MAALGNFPRAGLLRDSGWCFWEPSSGQIPLGAWAGGRGGHSVLGPVAPWASCFQSATENPESISLLRPVESRDWAWTWTAHTGIPTLALWAAILLLWALASPAVESGHEGCVPNGQLKGGMRPGHGLLSTALKCCVLSGPGHHVHSLAVCHGVGSHSSHSPRRGSSPGQRHSVLQLVPKQQNQFLKGRGQTSHCHPRGAGHVVEGRGGAERGEAEG